LYSTPACQPILGWKAEKLACPAPCTSTHSHLGRRASSIKASDWDHLLEPRT